MQKIQIRIFGTVQGVNFRSSAHREAEHLDLLYDARNEPDGSVVIEAEGEIEALKKFVGWCMTGPERARVERMEMNFLTTKNRLA